ncbi:MAG: type II secretion system protein, partial [Thiobacillus sp.]|nr:type II secretion system protein [Thiobacillus sp.]
MSLHVLSSQSGFTLIEMVVTVAIVSLLASIALPLAEVTATRSKEHELRLSLREIRTALDAYKQAVEEGRVAHAAQ